RRHRANAGGIPSIAARQELWQADHKNRLSRCGPVLVAEWLSHAPSNRMGCSSTWHRRGCCALSSVKHRARADEGISVIAESGSGPPVNPVMARGGGLHYLASELSRGAYEAG